MSQKWNYEHFDVVVIGGGSAGVAASIAAAKNGANVLLIEAGTILGGDLLSGLPVSGTLNARGEWIIGGVAKEIFELCKANGDFVAPMCDWRLMWTVLADPEAIRVAIIQLLAQYGVNLLLYTFAEDVVVEDGRMMGASVINKSQRTLITADYFIDCTGDGDIAVLCGGEFEKGDTSGELQPISLVFRMTNVDFEKILLFIRDNPEDLILGDNPVFNRTPAECAQELYQSGYPFVNMKTDSLILSKAISSGEMNPCASFSFWPISIERKELAFNTTRIANIDATDTKDLSQSLNTLTEQIKLAIGFAKKYLPGFEHAQLSAIAPKIGVRETRRVIGEYVLTEEDVLEARKSEMGIAKGCHHVDIHGSGNYQKRIPVKKGGSYDIPLGCLIPRSLKNVLIAGRCLSSTREANGSARVMGTCMATGEAAATAAALCIKEGMEDVRAIEISSLRKQLQKQGAVLEGTH
jgi:hypothetical protein